MMLALLLTDCKTTDQRRRQPTMVISFIKCLLVVRSFAYSSFVGTAKANNVHPPNYGKTLLMVLAASAADAAAAARDE